MPYNILLCELFLFPRPILHDDVMTSALHLRGHQSEILSYFTPEVHSLAQPSLQELIYKNTKHHHTNNNIVVPRSQIPPSSPTSHMRSMLVHSLPGGQSQVCTFPFAYVTAQSNTSDPLDLSCLPCRLSCSAGLQSTSIASLDPGSLRSETRFNCLPDPYVVFRPRFSSFASLWMLSSDVLDQLLPANERHNNTKKHVEDGKSH